MPSSTSATRLDVVISYRTHQARLIVTKKKPLLFCLVILVSSSIGIIDLLFRSILSAFLKRTNTTRLWPHTKGCISPTRGIGSSRGRFGWWEVFYSPGIDPTLILLRVFPQKTADLTPSSSYIARPCSMAWASRQCSCNASLRVLIVKMVAGLYQEELWLGPDPEMSIKRQNSSYTFSASQISQLPPYLSGPLLFLRFDFLVKFRLWNGVKLETWSSENKSPHEIELHWQEIRKQQCHEHGHTATPLTASKKKKINVDPFNFHFLLLPFEWKPASERVRVCKKSNKSSSIRIQPCGYTTRYLAPGLASSQSESAIWLSTFTRATLLEFIITAHLSSPTICLEISSFVSTALTNMFSALTRHSN